MSRQIGILKHRDSRFLGESNHVEISNSSEGRGETVNQEILIEAFSIFLILFPLLPLMLSGENIEGKQRK